MCSFTFPYCLVPLFFIILIWWSLIIIKNSYNPGPYGHWTILACCHISEKKNRIEGTQSILVYGRFFKAFLNNLDIFYFLTNIFFPIMRQTVMIHLLTEPLVQELHIFVHVYVFIHIQISHHGQEVNPLAPGTSSALWLLSLAGSGLGLPVGGCLFYFMLFWIFYFIYFETGSCSITHTGVQWLDHSLL